VDIVGHDYYHPITICMDGKWMSSGSFLDGPDTFSVTMVDHQPGGLCFVHVLI